MTGDLFGYVSARELAQDGMERAVEHADWGGGEPRWSERAYAILLDCAAVNPEFMTEDVRVYAHKVLDLCNPPDPRAWGAIVQRAMRERIVVRDRFETIKIPPSHARPMPVWRSLVYRRAA